MERADDAPPLTERLRHARERARRRVLRHRRGLAALLLGVGVLASVRAVAPPPPASEPVLVAARDLPAGHVVDDGDLVRVDLPPDVVPAGRVRTPVGRTLASPLRRGEAVTDVRVAGAGLAASAEGVAVPVRLTDAGAAGLLAAGDRIDVVAAGGGEPDSADPARPGSPVGPGVLLASCARVLAVPPGAGDAAVPGRLVVVETTPGEARNAGVTAATTYVTYTWCRR